MRSEIAQALLDKTPKETKIFIEYYADLVVLINQVLKEKGWTKAELASKLGKKPSEISKWLNGEHNFTLRSIAKLQAELDTVLLSIPKRKVYVSEGNKKTSMRAIVRKPIDISNKSFSKGVSSDSADKSEIIASAS